MDQKHPTSTDPVEALRRSYPPLLTTGQLADMMQCSEWDVRDKVHRGQLHALRWGQQFRFFRDKVIADLQRVADDDERTDQYPEGDSGERAS